MNRMFCGVAFAVGLLALAWVGVGFVGSSGLALLMTALITVVYLLGAWEIRQFRRATSGLATALSGLAQPLPDLPAWLAALPASLQPAVRLRIEGARVPLPGPALTPYLVGLLVMLGMLGTFLGMVVTFKGAVFALEGSADLQAMRAALAAPIKGLGLSFGTSVAGVAASAMLGLMSALSRRDRAETGRLLDLGIATGLRPFSLSHQRELTLQALQQQSQALPGVVDRLQALMDGLERRNERLDAQLLAQQARFHQETGEAYRGLARTVGQSLQDSLAAGARAAGDSLRPVVQGAMAEVAEESRRLHQRVFEDTRARLDALTAGFEASARTVVDGWATAQQQQARSLAAVSETVERRADALLAQQHALMDRLATTWRSELAALRDEEAARGRAAVERLDDLQAALARHLAALGTALEAPMTRLVQTAAEVPQAAAGVMVQLREEMGRMAERDHRALQERAELMAQVGGLLQTLNTATGEQRAAIDALVASAGGALDAQAGRAEAVAAQVAASAIELASLGDAFQHGVSRFSASNGQLIESLGRIESAIDRSMVRSDEQLAYYVAQAREVIDLSLASQQGIVEDLRRLRQRPAELAEGTAG